ncbi:hypothetical protein [Halalkalirubrum salinum]|nr:hypothetical protein [Halalkalirubrum salinum]
MPDEVDASQSAGLGLMVVLFGVAIFIFLLGIAVIWMLSTGM